MKDTLANARRLLPKKAFDILSSDIMQQHKIHRLQEAENQRCRELVDALEAVPNQAYGFTSTPQASIPETLGEFLKRRIVEHQQMIGTLEWFAAHIGLDKPDDNLLVRRVIFEGLSALVNQKRENKL